MSALPPIADICRAQCHRYRANSPRANADILRLVVASATVPGLPLLRGSSDVVRARITETAIARQNIASAVAVFEGAILAVPIHASFADLDHRAPRSLCALRVFWAQVYRCKTSRSHQNRAYHHLSNSMQCLVRHQGGCRYSIIFVGVRCGRLLASHTWNRAQVSNIY